MAIGDYFRLVIRLRNSFNLVEIQNQFVFRQLRALVFDTPEEDLVASWQNYAQAAYLGCFTSNFAIYLYQVNALPADLVSYESAIEPVDGSQTGDSMPQVTGGLLSLRTATLGRRGRGRIFLPPATEVYNTSQGYVAGGMTTLMQGLVTAVQSMSEESISYAGWEWGIFSIADQAFRPLTSAVPRNFWGVQRKRRF